MVGQMQEAERKRMHFCASLVQSWWRGKMVRRHADDHREAARLASKRARDAAMTTVRVRVD